VHEHARVRARVRTRAHALSLSQFHLANFNKQKDTNQGARKMKRNTLQHAATYCNMLQHICNTLHLVDFGERKDTNQGAYSCIRQIVGEGPRHTGVSLSFVDRGSKNG